MRTLAITGIGHGIHDAANEIDRAHARHAAGGADVGRNSLERHDGDRAGLLRDRGVFGRHHVHDDATLEHLREPALDRYRSSAFHVPIITSAPNENIGNAVRRGRRRGRGRAFGAGERATRWPARAAPGRRNGRQGLLAPDRDVRDWASASARASDAASASAERRRDRFGGTRGSGKCGSPAAESACERFQSGPYGWGDAFGDGLTDFRRHRLQRLLGRLADDAISHALADGDRDQQHGGAQPRGDQSAASCARERRTTSSLAARARRSLGLPIRCTSRSSPGAISTRAV